MKILFWAELLARVLWTGSAVPRPLWQILIQNHPEKQRLPSELSGSHAGACIRHFGKTFPHRSMNDYYTHLRGGINWMRRNKEVITAKGHATEVFTNWTVSYLEDREKKEEPFFLYLAYNAPPLSDSTTQRVAGQGEESSAGPARSSCGQCRFCRASRSRNRKSHQNPRSAETRRENNHRVFL